MNFQFGAMDPREAECETYTVTYTRQFPRSASTGALRVSPPSQQMSGALSAVGLNSRPGFPGAGSRPGPGLLLPPLQHGGSAGGAGTGQSARKGAGSSAPKAPAGNQNKNAKSAVSLGIIRLDYDYPPAPGDIDCPETYDYDVFYRVVPGLTFAMCQAGKMTPRVQSEFVEAIAYLEAQGVSGISGDCGFMMYFQDMARTHTKKPVFMSALAQLPAVTCAYGKFEKIAIMTANSKTLSPMRNLIMDECGVDPEDSRFIIVGCEDVPGFEAVAEGKKVNVDFVTPGMVKKAQATMQANPTCRAILLECTELPPYADALRAALGIPVYDAITCCDFFLTGMKDNKRFGLNNWQRDWDGKQDAYKFGQELSAEDRDFLVNPAH